MDHSDRGIDADSRKRNETAPRDRGISMVFQNYALYPHMTVEKNIYRNTDTESQKIYTVDSGRELP